MPAPYPQFIPQPFANNASGAFRNTIPNTTVTPGLASFSLGFPPITMQTVISGGRPPLGQDFNGLLYMLSSHTVYQQTGKPYSWSADVAAAVGGYAIGTLLGSTDGSTLWYNLTNANVSNPDAGGAGWVAMYSYGMQSIPGLTGGVRVLTSAEAAKSVVVLSGALVANVQVVLPNQVRRWLIVNTCTGAFTTTIKTAAGSGVAVPQAGFAGPVEVWSDGTNIYNVVAPVNLPIDQAATPLTIVQRTSAGYVFAQYFNQASALENFGMSEIYAGLGDGYLRKISPGNFQAQLALSNFAGQVSNAQVPVGAVNQWRGTILNDSALTGTPTAPTPGAGDNSTRIATTAFVQQATLGGVQAWADVTGARALGSVFTNSTGRPIQVNFSGNCRRASAGGGAFQGVCQGVQVGLLAAAGSTDMSAAFSFTVPPGAQYYVVNSGAHNGFQWAELS